MKRDFNKIHFNLKKIKYIIISFLIILILGVVVYSSSIDRSLNPEIKMVSGTEYVSGEEGQAIVRVIDSKNNPVSNADCTLNLLFPDKTFFLTDISMRPSSVQGNYYHSFITPEVPGIYEKHIFCKVLESDEKEYILNTSYSFHVSPALNLVVELSKNQKEQYENLLSEIRNLDSNFNYKINLVDKKLDDLYQYIDGNIKYEIYSIDKDIKDLNSSFNESFLRIESQIDTKLSQNLDPLFNKFRESYTVMAEIFSD